MKGNKNDVERQTLKFWCQRTVIIGLLEYLWSLNNGEYKPIDGVRGEYLAFNQRYPGKRLI